jgi:co-chaperonin GroES (HSP10)
MKILPLRNNIMFRFLDETSGSKGKFSERKLASGIVLPTLDSAQKSPRWGEVIAAGPDAQVKEGEYILIESLQWTFGTEVDGRKMWKTDDSKIIMATDDIAETRTTSFPKDYT